MISVHPLATAQSTALTLQPRMALKRLFLAIFMLLIPNLVSVYYQHAKTQSVAGELLMQYFNFNTEGNIPTFFSAMLLLTASALLFVIASQHKGSGRAKYWRVLGGVFLFMAMDESAQIHEGVTKLVYLVTNTIQLPGYFLYAWVIPYSLAVIVAGLFFFNFLLKLPFLIRNLFIVAGGLYVTGALGLEMLQGHYNIVYGYGNLHTSIFCTIEELLEMSGVSLFVYALLTWVSQSTGRISLRVVK